MSSSTAPDTPDTPELSKEAGAAVPAAAAKRSKSSHDAFEILMESNNLIAQLRSESLSIATKHVNNVDLARVIKDLRDN